MTARTIQELKENAEHASKTERALLALSEIPQPATARQISQHAQDYNGLTSTGVGRLLPHHPQVKVHKDGSGPHRYEIVAHWGD